MRLLSLAAACTLFAIVWSLDPVDLTDETFAGAIGEGGAVFVKFYAPWCGHCKRLAPTWEELSNHYENSRVKIARVDCTQYGQVCGENGVRGYPTLKLFHDGGVVQYQGSRELAALTSFVDDHLAKIPDEANIEVDEMGVVHLTDKDFTAYIAKGTHFVKFYAPWCGHCQQLAPTWSDLAAYFNTHNKDVHIVKVDCTENSETCRKFKVTGYPTLILFQDGAPLKPYDGNRDLEDFISFVVGSIDAEKQEEPEPQVQVLTKENFASVIAQGTTFVKFYAPWCGHCKRLAPTWDQLGKVTHSKTGITIAKVDCTEHKDLCEENQVRGYPTLILFKDGVKKSNYNGARDLQSLLSFVEN